MRTRLSLLACAAMLGAAVAFPLGVIASHRFSDVPNTNSFHADIDAIADVGVTLGCGPTTYCPKDYVTREQMAAFLNRLGALGPGKTPVVNADRVDGLTSGQFLRSDVAYTGRETCIGAAMIPWEAGYETYTFNGRRYGVGSGYMHCAPSLPDGATLTAFSGRLSDNRSDDHLSCWLYRYDKAAMGPPTTLESFGSSDAYHDGLFFRRRTSIAEPVVDNETYAYLITCFSSGGGPQLQVLHLDVEYSVAGVGHP